VASLVGCRPAPVRFWNRPNQFDRVATTKTRRLTLAPLSVVTRKYVRLRTNEVPRCCKKNRTAAVRSRTIPGQRLIGRLGAQTSCLTAITVKMNVLRPFVCLVLFSVRCQWQNIRIKSISRRISVLGPPTEPATLLPDMTSSPHFPPAMRIIHVREQAGHRLGSFPRS
jgi:hypothetical protein